MTDTFSIKLKYPLLFSAPETQTTSQEEGFLEGIGKDIASVPQALIGRVKSSLETGVPFGTAGFGMVPGDTELEKRALATIGGAAAAELTGGLVNPATARIGSGVLGKVLSRSAIGAAGVGTYTGIKEGKPAEGALTGAIGANVLGAIPGATRMLKNKVVKSVGRVLDMDPVFKAKVEQGLNRVVVDWHRAFTTGEQRLAKWVPATGQLMTKARMVGSLIGGNLTATYAKAVKGLNSYEQAVMGGIIEGKLKPTTQGLSGLVREGNEDKVIRAAAEVENLLKTIGAKLKELGVPVSDGEDGLYRFELLNDYLPHRIINTLQYVTPGPIQRDAIKAVIRSGVAKDEAGAIAWLDNLHKQANGLLPASGMSGAPYAGGTSKSGHLMARVVGLPGYEMNPELVLPAYFEHVGKRIALASEFGPLAQSAEIPLEQAIHMTPKTLSARQQYPRAFAEVDALADGPTKQGAEKAISDYLGKAKEVPWYAHYAQPIMTSQVITKLARGAIMQPSQMLTATVRTQLRGSFTNFVKTMRNDPEALDFATRSGVTLRGAVRQAEEALAGGGTTAEKFLNSVGFTQMDMKSRIFGALQGATFAENQAAKLARLESRVKLGDAGAKTAFDRISERLSKVGINPEDALRQGGQLTDEQLRIAGSNVSHDANFWGDTLSLPEVFASPGGRFLLQFKSFAAQQFVFTKNHISKPALEYIRTGGKKGDILPLIRAVSILPAGGEVIQDLKSLVANKQRPQQGLERYLDNLAAVSAFGLVGDAMNATKYGIEGLSSFVLGPAASTAIKGVYAASQLAQGKPTLAKKFVTRELLPFAGPVPSIVAPAIESATMPSKKRPPIYPPAENP